MLVARARRPRQLEKAFERFTRLAECRFHVGIALWDGDNFVLFGTVDRRVRA